MDKLLILAFVVLLLWVLFVFPRLLAL